MIKISDVIAVILLSMYATHLSEEDAIYMVKNGGEVMLVPFGSKLVFAHNSFWIKHYSWDGSDGRHPLLNAEATLASHNMMRACKGLPALG